MTRSHFEDYKQFPIPPLAGGPGDPTSLGYVYVIGFEEAGVVKIGSALAPTMRLTELQCGNPFVLHLRAAVSIYVGSPVLVEQAAHRLADDFRIRAEWFELETDEALAVVIKAARNLKAKFGAYVHAHEQSLIEGRVKNAIQEDAQEAERRRILRQKLGID